MPLDRVSSCQAVDCLTSSCGLQFWQEYASKEHRR